MRKKTNRKNCCHQCRRYGEHLTKCSRDCKAKFCNKCLSSRYGKNMLEELEPGRKWVCPKCRGGCGPGCKSNCCNCSVCFRAKGFEPVGCIKEVVELAGFTNVHDFLVYLETGESQEQIEERVAGGEAFKGRLGKEAAAAKDKEKKDVKESFDHITHVTATKRDFIMDHTRSADATTEDERGSENLHARDPFEAFSHVEMDIYLMTLWFNREKTLVGSQYSVTLRDKDLELAQAIKNRSSAQAMAGNLAVPRPNIEQERVRNRMKEVLEQNRVALKSRFALELDGIITDIRETIDRGY